MHDVVTAWRRALTAEVCWIGSDDRPETVPVTPLLLDDVPCLALPYMRRTEADALRAAPEVAFAATDVRSLPDGASGVAVFGETTVGDDLDGSVFAEKLIDQELAKHPPSRTLVDSMLLRRENWWWLPRLIVRLDRITHTAQLSPRTDPSGEALLVRDGLGMRLDTVTTRSWDEPRPRLAALDGRELRGDGVPALVLGHDYTAPDFERWETWCLRGRLWGDELVVEERHGERGAPMPPLGLLERIRRQRRLEKACRQGIAAAERGVGGTNSGG